MSNLSVEGKLKRIHDEQVISERFKKREFVIETEEQYPQVLMFQLVQDKTNLIDQFSIGDKVEIFFNLRGREWQKDPSAEIRVLLMAFVSLPSLQHSLSISQPLRFRLQCLLQIQGLQP